jgi:hypothetical protein
LWYSSKQKDNPEGALKHLDVLFGIKYFLGGGQDGELVQEMHLLEVPNWKDLQLNIISASVMHVCLQATA